MLKTLMCDPQLFNQDLSGQTYIVTGANSGSGLATMTQLVKQGAHVVAGCRRVAAGEDAVASLQSLPGSAEVIELDLSKLESVRSFAAEFQQKHSQLKGLVNNAGVMNCPEGKTDDGYETQFATNHLGHFLLTELLMDILKASAPARIVCVSSVAHAGFGKTKGTIHFEDLNYDQRPYNGFEAYAQSKLANVLHALHLSQRLKGTGVTVVSVHPGWIRSNLAKHSMPVWVQNVLMRPFSGLLGMMSYQEGAQTTLHCLLDDQVPSHNGEYYSQNSLFYADKACRRGGWPMQSPSPHARDLDQAHRLHEVSLQLVGLKEAAN